MTRPPRLSREGSRMIQQCLTEGRYLTGQEYGYLESLNDQLACGEELSPEEIEEVERIYVEKVP